MSELAVRMQVRRIEMGLTQRDLAKKANVSLTTVSFTESGKKKPHAKTVIALAKALDVEPSEWLKL